MINHGRETEILRFRTYVPGSNPHGDKIVFLYNLVIMYWTLYSIYMQFECQNFFVARGVYCLKFGFFVARGMYCLK